MAKNICQCPQPPGGIVECEADQLAICRSVNGEIQTACLDAPSHLRLTPNSTLQDRKRYCNWVLTQVTGEERPLSAELQSEHVTVLQGGVYEDSARGEIVMFRLPDSIAGTLGLLMPASGKASAGAY